MVHWLPYSSHTSHIPSQTSCLPWISYATQKLMLDSCKMLQKQSEAFHTFPSLKHNFITYRSSKVSSRLDCIFEIHQLWQSGFSRVYSNCCCSCSFEPEIIKIGQSSHKMYSNNILNFQESSTISNACTKKSGNLLKAPRIINSISYDNNGYTKLAACIYTHTFLYRPKYKYTHTYPHVYNLSKFQRWRLIFVITSNISHDGLHR